MEGKWKENKKDKEEIKIIKRLNRKQKLKSGNATWWLKKSFTSEIKPYICMFEIKNNNVQCLWKSEDRKYK